MRAWRAVSMGASATGRSKMPNRNICRYRRASAVSTSAIVSSPLSIATVTFAGVSHVRMGAPAGALTPGISWSIPAFSVGAALRTAKKSDCT